MKPTWEASCSKEVDMSLRAERFQGHFPTVRHGEVVDAGCVSVACVLSKKVHGELLEVLPHLSDQV